ncbi:hypothetical protein DSM112329_01419 [Paraconexibacter sp. AEG42_29]|uniref:Cupin type-2 domain-containing protein n=1 Tax=Paraconexibacter sp. AEG42_29 TaxID=2997339 RepID=A0AAU7ASF5_9ACTN
MKVVKPAADHEVPRGVVGGAEISDVTAGAKDIYLGIFRVDPSARSRPHYHASCESAVYMLRGELEIQWGDGLEHTTTLVPGDMAYVPPQETHVLHNRSADIPAEYVVARNAANEESIEVTWSG